MELHKMNLKNRPFFFAFHTACCFNRTIFYTRVFLRFIIVPVMPLQTVDSAALKTILV
jgi:hypothetical protein